MAGKINRITATGVKGIYKDKTIEVHIGDSWGNTNVFIDGKQIKAEDGLIQSIHISIRCGKPTVMTIEKLKGSD